MKNNKNKSRSLKKTKPLSKKDREMIKAITELEMSPEQERELLKRAAASAGKNLERLKNLAVKNPDMASWFPE